VTDPSRTLSGRSSPPTPVRPLGFGSALSCPTPSGRRSSSRRVLGLSCERTWRGGAAPFAFQCRRGRSRSPWIDALLAMSSRAAGRCGTLTRLGFCRRRRLAKLDPRTARFGQSDGDRLFRRTRSVLAVTDVVHFLTNEFTRLCARGLPLSFIVSCPLERPFLWHDWVTSFFACWPTRTKSAGSVPSLMNCWAAFNAQCAMFNAQRDGDER